MDCEAKSHSKGKGDPPPPIIYVIDTGILYSDLKLYLMLVGHH